MKIFKPLSCFSILFSHGSIFIIYFQSHIKRLKKIHDYILIFCYVMYYIVPDIYIVGTFLGDSFYCYSKQIVFAVAKESLIPYNLTQRAPGTKNL